MAKENPGVQWARCEKGYSIAYRLKDSDPWEPVLLWSLMGWVRAAWSDGHPFCVTTWTPVGV